MDSEASSVGGAGRGRGPADQRAALKSMHARVRVDGKYGSRCEIPGDLSRLDLTPDTPGCRILILSVLV